MNALQTVEEAEASGLTHVSSWLPAEQEAQVFHNLATTTGINWAIEGPKKQLTVAGKRVYFTEKVPAGRWLMLLVRKEKKNAEVQRL